MTINESVEGDKHSGRWSSRVVQSNIKLFFIGFLVLVMLIPLVFITGVVNDRQRYSNQARNEMESSWGKEQHVLGPVLVVPYTNQWIDDKKKPQASKNYFFTLPETFKAEGKLEPERRNRGIYEAILYSSAIQLTGKIPAVTQQDIIDTDVLAKSSKIQWDKAFLAVGIQDLTGLSSNQTALINQIKLSLEPGQSFQGLRIPLEKVIKKSETPALSLASLNFDIALTLRGSEQLQFFPVGKTSQVHLTSPWPSPSFNGRYLPVKRELSDTDFTADWDVSYFARSFPQNWHSTDVNLLAFSKHNSYSSELSDSHFGVSLFDPVDFYHQVERVVKYGILFFALTFLTFFVFEVVAGVTVHLFQYILVGLALCLFYLILLAFAEVVGFNLAYAIASIGIVGLITYYTSGFISDKKQLAIVTVILSALYIYLFTLLRLEDFALLFGSMGLFVALAVLMAVTRKLTWGAPSKATQEAAKLSPSDKPKE